MSFGSFLGELALLEGLFGSGKQDELDELDRFRRQPIPTSQ